MLTIPLTIIALTQPIPQNIAVRIFPHLHNYPPEGIDPNPGAVTLKSSSSCRIERGNTDSASSSGVLQSSTATLNLQLTAANLSTPLWIQCTGKILVQRQGVKTSYYYGGPIYAHAVASGPELIEVKPINDYLKGVVPSEMPAFWPDEALQAQAVAARTYAVFHMLAARLGLDPTQGHVLWDVDDTVQFQAYLGELNRTNASDLAVDETGSNILTYQGGVIQAYFSADAGGYTEEADHVWPVNAPYCQSKPEPFQNWTLDGGFWAPWTVNIPMATLNQKLSAAGLISASNPIVNLYVDPANQYVSGRASLITVELTDGTTSTLDALVFEKDLGLRSTLFTAMSVDSTGTTLTIQGQGFGHGVGMSQYGARLEAMNGWAHSDILNFYYTGVQICAIQSDGSVSCGSSVLP